MPHMNGRPRKYNKKTKKGGSNIAGKSGPNTSPSPQIPPPPPNSPATSPVKNPSPNRDAMGQEKKKGPFSRFTRRMPKMPKMKMGDIKNKMMPKKPGFMSGFMSGFKMPGFFSKKKMPKPNMTGGKRRRTRKKNRKNKKSNKRRRRKGSR